jgi:hypothetical protein
LVSESEEIFYLLGVPGTYAVEKINGIMFLAFAAPLPGKIPLGQVYPKKFYPLVKGGDMEE